jgi:hypothetical protein
MKLACEFEFIKPSYHSYVFLQAKGKAKPERPSRVSSTYSNANSDSLRSEATPSAEAI